MAAIATTVEPELFQDYATEIVSLLLKILAYAFLSTIHGEGRKGGFGGGGVAVSAFVGDGLLFMSLNRFTKGRCLHASAHPHLLTYCLFGCTSFSRPSLVAHPSPLPFSAFFPESHPPNHIRTPRRSGRASRRS